MNKLNGRRQYLVTYSQADPDLFPSREMFGNMLEREFNTGASKVKVDYWACCQENHKEKGIHYHCALKLTGVKKWVSVKERIQRTYGIVVNFSDRHDYYLSAYRYVNKEDENVAHSKDHPNLSEAKSPSTKKSIAANKRKSSDKSNPCQAKKRLRLTNQEAAMFIRKNNIHTYTELLAVAEERRKEELKDISDFIFNRQENFLRELISKSWQMAEAATKLKISNRDRLDVLNNYADQEPCICEGEWLAMAKEVLSLNGISERVFASAIYANLQFGRGKYRNIIIVGPTNCAKTFILKPLCVMFKEDLFENPANHKYGWIGAEKANLMMLQDFRWSSDLISWKDFLLLLEGENVKLPTPKNIYKEDIQISGKVSIFATGKCEVKFRGAYNATDNREDEMMSARWKVFSFKHQFKEAEQKHVAPCGHCFANFVHQNGII